MQDGATADLSDGDENLLDHLMEVGVYDDRRQVDSDSDDDIACSMDARERDWNTLPDSLIAPATYFPCDTWGSDKMKLPQSRIDTMDAVSGCWGIIPSDSQALLSDVSDGATWAICERCVSQIPKRITDAIWFFNMVNDNLSNMAGFAIPSKNVSLKLDRGNHKIVKGLVLHTEITEKASIAASQFDNGFDINKVMLRRDQDRTGVLNSRVQPIKIKLAFTGVNYTSNGEDANTLVAVLFVTGARNFDLLGFILEHVLERPNKNHTNYKSKFADWERLNKVWTSTIRFVAYENLGIDSTRFGLPEQYYNEPGGALGVDSLLNIFQIPIQILGIVKSFVLKKLASIDKKMGMSDVNISSCKTIGLPPDLDFSRAGDRDVLKDYVEYMHAFVDNMETNRRIFSNAMDAFNAPPDKESKNDKEAKHTSVCDLPSCGGWPRTLADGKLGMFGLPLLPIILNFNPLGTAEQFLPPDIWVTRVLGGPGGIPAIVKACMRVFLLQEVNSDGINWDILLTDSRLANPSRIVDKYFGERADPLAGLCIKGHLLSSFKGMLSDIEHQRQSDVSVLDMMTSMERYVKSFMMQHENMIESGSIRSDRVTQSLEILNFFEFQEVCSGDKVYSIKSTMARLCVKMGNTTSYDPSKRAVEALMSMFKEVNETYALNSTNLEFFFQMMITRILWMIGENNDTVHAFFQGIFVSGGAGTFEVTMKEGKKRSDAKANSSGADHTSKCMAACDQALLDLCGMTDPNRNLQSPSVCMGITPASIPLMTSATIVDGKITNLPEPEFNRRDSIISEVRGSNQAWDEMVKLFPRLTGPVMCRNTCDPNKTGLRQSIRREQIEVPSTLFLCSNKETVGGDIEASKTVSLVLHAQAPGSAPYCKRQRTGEFNSQTCHSFDGSKPNPKDKRASAFFLTYSQIYTLVFPGLMNNMGISTIEINPSVMAFIDWLTNNIKNHLEGVFSRDVVESFSRIVKGYTTRAVGLEMWAKMIQYLSESSNREQAVQKTVVCLQCNALSLAGVARLGQDVITRGADMGALLMIACFAKDQGTPVLDIKSLMEFFESTNVPTSGESLVVLQSVKTWIKTCLQKNRFCPENPGSLDLQNNVSCYVTSDGNAEGGPSDEKTALYRFMKSKVNGCLTIEIDKKIKDVFGSQLFEACHMGPTMYGNAICHLLSFYEFDIRKILGPNLFASKKHMTKLGLIADVPGLKDFFNPNESPKFAKIFNIGGDALTQPCVALGINVWALLAMVSLSGAVMHPKISSKFASNAVKLILDYAPISAVPGNNIVLSRFNVHTTAPERIIVKNKHPSLHHMMRPTDDMGFLSTGKFTYGQAQGNLLPEDQFHCGFLQTLSRMYCCDIWELDAAKVVIDPELVPDQYYSVWRTRDQVVGSLIVDTKNKQIILDYDKGEQGISHVTFGYNDWHIELRKLGFLVTPMIWRSGACIRSLVGEPPVVTLGCLVPFKEFKSNYNHKKFGYQSLIGPDNMLELSFKNTIEALVCPGEDFFLDLHAEEYEDLLLSVPSHRSSRRYLLVRLSVPRELKPEIGKLSLVYTMKSLFANMDVSDTSMGYITAHPWHLSLEVEASDVISFLNPV